MQTIAPQRRSNATEFPALPLAVIDIVGMEPRDTEPTEEEVRAILAALDEEGPMALNALTITGVGRDRMQVLCLVPTWTRDGKVHRDPSARDRLWRAFLRVRRVLGRGGRCNRHQWRRPDPHAVGTYIDSRGREVHTRTWWAGTDGLCPRDLIDR